MRVKGKSHKTTFINVYALTETTEEEVIDTFYDELQTICEKIPKHDAHNAWGLQAKAIIMLNSAKKSVSQTFLESIACM